MIVVVFWFVKLCTDDLCISAHTCSAIAVYALNRVFARELSGISSVTFLCIVLTMFVLCFYGREHAISSQISSNKGRNIQK